MDFTNTSMDGTVDQCARYKMPQITSSQINKKGGQTQITNLSEVANQIKRTNREIFSYIQRGLATSSGNDKKAILNGKFTTEQLQTLLVKYIQEWVLCGVCDNPETSLTKTKKELFLSCAACGGKTDKNNS